MLGQRTGDRNAKRRGGQICTDKSCVAVPRVREDGGAAMHQPALRQTTTSLPPPWCPSHSLLTSARAVALKVICGLSATDRSPLRTRCALLLLPSSFTCAQTGGR